MGTWLKRGALLPLLLLTTVAAGAGPASAATVCASADGPTATTSTLALANSALCLVNQERTSRGLKPLKLNTFAAGSQIESLRLDVILTRRSDVAGVEIQIDAVDVN